MTLRFEATFRTAALLIGCISMTLSVVGCPGKDTGAPGMGQAHGPQEKRGKPGEEDTCQASCDGIQCGQNECGEPCGECRPGSNCDSGLCICTEGETPGASADPGGSPNDPGGGFKPGSKPGGEACGAVGTVGVCDGHTLKKCVDGALVVTPCAQFGLACGFDQTLMNSQGAFSCIETQTLCPDVPDSGRCDGQVLKWCDEAKGEVVTVDCHAEHTYCGWTGSFYCCHEQEHCVPLCQGRQCGDDGCGGSCGNCDSGKTCTENGQCVKDEPPSTCEADETGECDGNVLSYLTNGCCVELDCTLAFASEPGLNQVGVCGLDEDSGLHTCLPCTPSCQNKQCGDDGCGGSCGECPKGAACRSDGSCDGSENPCVGAKNGTECDDGNACTTKDRCWEGQCVGKMPLHCNDSNKCTKDSCDPGSGCVHQPVNGIPCQDGDKCTVGDKCWDGSCRSGKQTACDDDDVCTQDLCAGGKCTHLPANGVACDDGDACTTGEECWDKECSGGDVRVCDDGNECTKDYCDPASGCVFADDNGRVCDDGNACTLADQCWDGDCVAGAGNQCSDSNPCTIDKCDPKLGCVFTANDGAGCSDGDVCTTSDQCWDGQCRAGKPLVCDDGNLCTQDECDEKRGCVFVSRDGRPCDDSSACTTHDRCVEKACVGKSVDCDDDNVCTIDFCDPKKGCVNQPNDGAGCDDGNACSLVDRCTAGECKGTEPLDCDDGSECTKDSCHSGTGCKFTHLNGKVCDDGNACTAKDRCWDGACKGSGSVECDDDNICTADHCYRRARSTAAG